MSNVWTEEKLELLKALFEEGLSSGNIANAFNQKGFPATRNSICGKLHRLGWADSDKPKRAVKDKPAAPDPHKIKKPKPAPQSLSAAKVETGPKVLQGRPPVLLRETGDDDCRAIVGYGNGQLSEAYCCGEKTILKMVRGRMVRAPWCEYHNRIYTVEEKR